MEIDKITHLPNTKITLPASKSIANRILILNALSGNETTVKNLSKADDTVLMNSILRELEKSKKSYIFNIKNAGTTLRFLTAYLSQKKGVFELQCDDRMKLRPIGVLVDALRTLGAKIEYLEKENFPPLKIYGTNLDSKKIEISGKISSQYISALLMIAPTLPTDLNIEITDEITSRPYIEMTLKLMTEFGIKYAFNHNFINIPAQKFSPPKTFTIESDWSAASYWYGFASLLNEKEIVLPNLFKNSIQGDSKLIEIYKNIGIDTHFENNNVILKKNNKQLPKYLELNLQNEPDLAPSIAVNICLLNIKFKLTGLDNLHIKECDRIEAIIENLYFFGYFIKETSIGVLEWNGESKTQTKTCRSISPNKYINTHNDHRIAMAFSLFATKQNIIISNHECVEKSYPDFWENF